MNINFDEIMKKCCICNETYVCLDEVIKYPCNCKYIYHKSCLFEWLSYSGSGCPICRKPYKDNYFLQGVYSTNIKSPDFEPFYYKPPVNINTFDDDTDDEDTDDTDDEDTDDEDTDDTDNEDYTGNPTMPTMPTVPTIPLQSSEHQFTPDTPLNPLVDPEFSLSIDHSFSIPLYINYNQPPTSTTSTITNQNSNPITTQLFNQNFGLNLHNNI